MVSFFRNNATSKNFVLNVWIVPLIQAINKRCSQCNRMDCTDHGVEFDGEDSSLVTAFADEIATVMQRKQMETALSKVLICIH